MNFDHAFAALIGNEGGYSFNPADPGGETMWGITARVARSNGYQGEMKFMPRDFAKGLYQKLYWTAARCDDLPEVLRFQVFDAAVNSGVEQAALWLQRAAGVADDGAIGPATLAAAAVNPARVAVRLDAQRLKFMAARPTWPAFGRGWANRIGDNLEALAGEM
jgi:lysozyme family protein